MHVIDTYQLLPDEPEQVLDIADGSGLLTCNYNKTTKAIDLYAHCPHNVPTVGLTFYVIKKDAMLPDTFAGTYFGTCFLPNGDPLHIYFKALRRGVPNGPIVARRPDSPPHAKTIKAGELHADPQPGDTVETVPGAEGGDSGIS